MFSGDYLITSFIGNSVLFLKNKGTGLLLIYITWGPQNWYKRSRSSKKTLRLG